MKFEIIDSVKRFRGKYISKIREIEFELLNLECGKYLMIDFSNDVNKDYSISGFYNSLRGYFQNNKDNYLIFKRKELIYIYAKPKINQEDKK